MSDLAITKSLPKTLILTTLLLLMTLACLWAGLAAPGLVRIAGWCGLILFGAGFLIVPFLYLRKQDLLVLENAGFREYSSVASIGGWGLPWEQVAQIRPGKQSQEIYVDLYNPDLYFAKMPLRPRIFSTINHKMGICDIAISLQFAKLPGGMSRGDIIRTMYDYRNHRMRELGFKEF